MSFEKIKDRVITVEHKQGNRWEIDADQVVIASGSRRNSDLANELKGKVRELYVAGASRQSGRIPEAIYRGREATFGDGERYGSNSEVAKPWQSLRISLS